MRGSTTRLLLAADLIATYVYCFAANELPLGSTGPRASITYWLLTPWVYLLIAPVAGISTWRAVEDAHRWVRARATVWRLPAEGAALSLGGLVIAGAIGSIILTDFLLAGLQAAGFGGVLGLILALLNRGLLKVRNERAEAPDHAT